MESQAEHEEVPKEEATVETFGALKERYVDRHLAVGCHWKLQKQTWKKLAAACRGMICHAIPAQRKEHCCQQQGKDKAVLRTQKG
jgi:hypothetical protein